MKFSTIISVVALAIFCTSITAQTNLKKGSGSFAFSGGIGHENDTIKVFYHMPKNFNNKSKILLVIPGAGRNADDYRDSWITTSEKHDVLIISPSYAEKKYDFGAYHLGGIVKNLDLRTGISFEKGTNRVYIEETVDRFHINENSEEWLFHDFDRLFTTVVKAVGSHQKTYDVFGHSAGGQILHRFALFAPNSKADRILASNAGSYTIPDHNTSFPFGVKDVEIKNSELKKSFKKNLVLFLGQQDNEKEMRGLILRSPTVDKQGTHRFARGNYFYTKSKKVANSLNTKFNWKLHVVSGVGHNQRKMAEAAAKYLYQN